MTISLPVPGCKLCAMGVKEVEPGLSHNKLSKHYDVAKSSVQRHIKHVKASSSVGNTDEPVTRAKVGSTYTEISDSTSLIDKYGIPQSVITSRTISEWDASSGKAEKVTFSPNAATIHTALQYEDLVDIFENYTPKPIPDLKDREDSSFVLCVADLQVGKTDFEGGTPELIERILDSVEKAADRIAYFKPKELYIVDLGDIIENFNNHSAQRETNDLSLTEQIRTARHILLTIIRRLSHLAPKVFFVSVPSNHCEVRVAPQASASTTDNDFGLELNHQLEDVFAGREGFEHLNFVRPEPLSETVTLHTVDGTYLSFVHGHQSKTQARMSEWWKGQSHGRRNSLDKTDILVHGHYHNYTASQSGGRWLFGAPTLDAGSAYFTNKTGETSLSGMLSLRTNAGMWSDVSIL